MNEAIRVLICDDHALVRAGLRKLLEADEGFVVIGEAASADDAIAGAAEVSPDVLLLDVTMPGRSGIDAIPDIAEAAPGTKILMLSMQDDPAYARQAFAAGAGGYLLKDAADTELVKALREVNAGRRYVHPVIRMRLDLSDIPDAGDEPSDALSRREAEVLRLLALGHTNQEVARLFFISVRTVETHRARLMQKLGLKTRAEIVRYALEHGELAAEYEPERQAVLPPAFHGNAAR